MSQIRQQIIAIHTLPNISRNESNQAMIFGQLKEYNVKNIFLQILCRKGDRETSSSPLLFFK